MPWGPRPQAASIALLSGVALIAAAAGLRQPESLSPLPLPVASNASITSIDSTLTRDESGCAGVRSTVWHPLSGVEYTGRLRVTLPAQLGGALVMYVGDSVPLQIEASTPTGEPVSTSQERLIGGPGISIPPDFWLEDGSPDRAPQQLTRVQIDASGDRDRTVVLSLGRRAPRVLARLVGYAAGVRVPVCAEPIRAGEIYFATGWFGEEHDPAAGAIRWMRDYGALVVSSTHDGAARVRVRLAPAIASSTEADTRLSVRVNDVLDLAPTVVRSGFQEYEWSVPDTAWVAGSNELFFRVSQTRVSGSRRLGLALASLNVQ